MSEERKGKCRRLEAENSELEQKLALSESEKYEANRDLDRLEAKCQSADLKIAAAEPEADLLKQEVSHLQEQVASMSEERKGKCRRLEAENSELEQKLALSESEKELARRNEYNASRLCDTLEGKCQSADSKIAEAVSEADLLRQEVSHLQEQVASMSEERKGKCRRLEAVNLELEQKLASIESEDTAEFSKLRHENAVLTSKCATLETTCHTSTSEAADAAGAAAEIHKQEKAILEQRVAEVGADIALLREEKEQLMEVCVATDGLRIQIASTEDEKTQLVERVAELEAELSDSRLESGENEKLQEMCRSLEGKCEAAAVEAEAVARELQARVASMAEEKAVREQENELNSKVLFLPPASFYSVTAWG
jgi:chromosome segregation ATPase